MPTSRLEGPIHVAGSLSADTIIFPSGSEVGADEQEHRYIFTYSQESATAAADGAWVIHIIHGATGTLNTFKCGVVVACIGAAVIDFDLLIDGATALSAAVRVDNGDAAYALVAGTLSTTAVTVNSVLEVSVDGTAGGGTLGKGVFAVLEMDEDAA